MEEYIKIDNSLKLQCTIESLHVIEIFWDFSIKEYNIKISNNANNSEITDSYSAFNNILMVLETFLDGMDLMDDYSEVLISEDDYWDKIGD